MIRVRENFSTLYALRSNLKKMDLSKFGVEVKNNGNSDKPDKIDDIKLEINIDEIKGGFTEEIDERFLPWFLKYQVEKFEDLIETNEIKIILKFIQNYKPGKGLLLCGSAGSGKTTTLTLIGNYINYEIFELNASDTRNKKSIDALVGDAIKQKSLFGKPKMILIDEVDGVSGTEDRGGVAELTKYVKESSYPIVFTANDSESDKIKSLAKVCIVIDFENHSKELLKGIGIKIFKAENIKYDEKELLEFIEKRNSTDIRGFINDLQASVNNSKFEVDENLELREYKKKIENLLDKIFFSYPEDSFKSNFNSDIDLDDLMLYLEENIPNVYSKNALIEAFNEISKADIFKGKIMKWQYWRYLVYVNFYLTYGVSNAKDKPKKTPYKRNQRILKKWIYGNKYNAIRARTKIEKEKGEDKKFIENLAKVYSTSAKRCRKNDLYHFAFQYKNNLEFQKSMDEKFKITEDIKKTITEL